jgi:hypothetical protein
LKIFAQANENIAAFSATNNQSVIPLASYLVTARLTKYIKNIDAGKSSAKTVPEVK